MKFYTLNIRVEKDFYPVDYEDGSVCWDSSRAPTIFASSALDQVQFELLDVGLVPEKDFTFTLTNDIKYVAKKQPSPRMRLVQDD